MAERKSSLAGLIQARECWSSAPSITRFHVAWWAAFRAVLLSLLIAVPVGLFVARPPSPEILEALIRPFLLKDCRPEPGEQLSYALFLLLLTPSFLFFLGRALRRPIDPSAVERTTFKSQLFLLGLFLFTGLRLREWWRFFPDSTVLIVAAAAAYWLRDRFPKARLKRLIDGIPQRELLAWSGAAALTALSLIHSIFSEYALGSAGDVVRYHYSYALDEVAAVASGNTVLVDFFPQYVRVLPYLLEPIFHRVGLSITSFSLSMALLNGIALFCGWILIRRSVRTPLKAMACFAAITGLFAHQDAGARYASVLTYHAVGPFRIFLPMLSLVSLSSALRSDSRTWASVAALVSSTALLNNPDFGLPTWVAVSAALTIFGSRPMRSLLVSLSSLGAVIAAFIAFTWARSGQWPDFSVGLEFQRLFAWSGFFMLKLPAIGIYQWVFATCFSGMIVALTRRVLNAPQEIDRHRNGLLLATGLMGMGCLIYYVGRSQWIVTTATFWIFSLCLVLLVVEAFPLRATRTAKIPLLISSLFLLGGISILPLRVLDLGPKLTELSETGGELSRRLEATTKEVRTRSTSHPVALIFPYGQLVATRAGVRNASPFAEEGSMISRSQLQRLGAAIERNCVTLVAFKEPKNDLLEILSHSGFRQASIIDEIRFWERPLTRLPAPCTVAAAGA